MRSFPEHFLCSANVLFLCQTNVYVNEAASFTDENEFGMDLSNFKKVGKGLFTFTVRALRLEECKYFVTLLAREGVSWTLAAIVSAPYPPGPELD